MIGESVRSYTGGLSVGIVVTPHVCVEVGVIILLTTFFYVKNLYNRVIGRIVVLEVGHIRVVLVV